MGRQQQLELRFWPRESLWTCIDDYLKSRELLGRAESTLEDDYHWRAAWLLKVLGPRTPIGSITHEQLEEVARKHGPNGSGALLYSTIAQRFKFLRQAMNYAAKRKVLPKADVLDRVELPRDVLRKKPVPSVAKFAEFRMSLPPERFRWLADNFFWTGIHNHDAWTLQWWMLEPDYEWKAGEKLLATGRYWRRVHKTHRCEPCWIPMEPEFREAVLELFAANPDRRPERLVTGRVWNLKRTFDAACDRAALPRYTPIRLRAGFARMLRSRYDREYVRIAMGHEAHDSKTEGGKTTRVQVTERHYLGPSDDLFLAALSMRASLSASFSTDHVPER